MIVKHGLRTVAAVCGLAGCLSAASGLLTADASVQSHFPYLNFGSLPQMQVNNSVKGLLSFDLSNLPAGVTPAMVTRATLKLWVSKVGTAGPVDIHRTTGPWDEGAVTWALAPADDADPLQAATIMVNGPGVWVAANVTGMVAKALTLGETKAGFSLFTSGATDVYFDSKESTSTSHPAELEINLAGPKGDPGSPGVSGATGATGPAGVDVQLSSFQVRDVSIGALAGKNYFLSCPSGYPQLVSGGCGYPFYDWGGADYGIGVVPFVTYSGPDPNHSNAVWMCGAYNTTSHSETMRIYVQCAK